MKARWLLAMSAVATLAGAVGGVLYLQGQGVTPRALAPYIEKRTSGHNGVIVASGQWLGGVLRRLDRGEQVPYPLPALTIGAHPIAAPAPVAGKPILVDSADGARRAFAAALPGQSITFLPGVYQIDASLTAARPGSVGMPVVVRAERPGTVTIEFATSEGFVVAAPYWTFENLTIRGACAQAANCEHAFHVVGRGAYFVSRNNTITDFNAHFKINGDRNGFPDNGLIEGNTLTNSAPRPTYNPVTPIDLVAASGWIIRGNLITDFIKAHGDRISYGAFAKGAAANTVFERNVVLCEQKFKGLPGQRVGLSFGGGGTGKQYCRDRKCITEHDGGMMRANLVSTCSDAGIYVNSGAGSRLVDNTLLDTAGVQVRYPESSVQLDGNLIDGAVTSRDGGVVREGDNHSGSVAALYAGLHPQRALFAAPGVLDLRWSGTTPRRTVQDRLPDLCGAGRPASMAYGAFEDFAACLAPRSASFSASTASNSAPN